MKNISIYLKRKKYQKAFSRIQALQKRKQDGFDFSAQFGISLVSFQAGHFHVLGDVFCRALRFMPGGLEIHNMEIFNARVDLKSEQIYMQNQLFGLVFASRNDIWSSYET